MPARRIEDLPSNPTKENYAKYLLSAKSRGAIFAIDEAICVAEWPVAGDCGAWRL